MPCFLDVFSTKDVFKECMASCWPNPCQNGAECVEKWGAHQCICVNQWAHSGHNCEIGMLFFYMLFWFSLNFTTFWANSADNILIIFLFYFSKKIVFDILCKLYPLETICMKRSKLSFWEK